MSSNDVIRSYGVDISRQFENDVNRDTGWVSRAAEWLKNRDVDYDTVTGDVGNEGINQIHTIYFANEDDAIMFRLAFG